ncbi:MAG: amidohydrolase family protein [Actinobacteria bacterium]|nr:amidohydrolase family protein [Actinomycetota bacterium]
MRIFANQAHIFPESIWLNGNLCNLLYIMKICGIDKSIVLAPFSSQMQDMKQDPNEWLANEISKYPQLIGFGTIDFAKGDVVKQVETIHSLGFRGIKLHPEFQRFHVLGNSFLKVCEVAEELELILDFNTGVHGNMLSMYSPILFDEVVCKYPRTKIILEYVGGHSLLDQVLAMIRNNNYRVAENNSTGMIFTGLTSVFDDIGEESIWFLVKEKIEELVKLTGEDYVVFGLGFPYRTAEEIKKDIEYVMNLPVSEEFKRKILCDNLERLINL